MTNQEIIKKAASALRELSEQNDLFQDCIKLAFDMAKRGQIENEPDAIIKKAQELLKNKDELPVVKKAMELSNNYDFIGNLEKKASANSNSDPSAEEVFENVLKGL